MNLNRILENFNKSYIKLGTVLALITLIGIVTVSHYGISVDEANHLLILKWNWKLIQQGKTMPGDYRFHGIVFNGAAEIVFQIKHFIQNHSFAPVVLAENS